MVAWPPYAPLGQTGGDPLSVPVRKRDAKGESGVTTGIPCASHAMLVERVSEELQWEWRFGQTLKLG